MAERIPEDTADGEWAPHGIDISVPSIARVYDALIGGKDNYAVDRAVAEAVMRIVPGAELGARGHRAVLARGVRFLAGQGIDQFVDLGSGLPAAQNTHQIAQAVNPDATVVYVDNDPIVLAHGRALLADNNRTTVITADMREPDVVLGHPDMSRLIDFDRPVALLLVGVVHHLADAEKPHDLVRVYRDALAPGSFLFLTHFVRSGRHAEEVEKVMLADLGSGRFRTHEEITAFFDDLELVEPGLTFTRAWRSEEALPDPLPELNRLTVTGIARKPAST
ncbi:SAM-dependent methyltransferase [Streptomyces sp. SID3343]|uniref:SAM-dependent methyltransferase n=1 Tax=Streptomyces sp. SID3343 TaxID=2690260 RepID=UPI00136939E8|nr:SAM-dependent methyltransferase [Streptomyces sp. SID3343]MYW05486.1 SAM-dependent methyltransferase [Streptomyces sp. SID3343]